MMQSESDKVEYQIMKYMKSKQFTLSSAESCTGGLFAARMIDVSGASSVFMHGQITYSVESKVKALGIPMDIIDKYGVVSKEVAKEMAEREAYISGTDISVSVTGNAGPDGGTVESPVGLVYIGLYFLGTTHTKKLLLQGERRQIREMAVEEMCQLLMEHIQKK